MLRHTQHYCHASPHFCTGLQLLPVLTPPCACPAAGMNGHGCAGQRRPKKDAPHEMELQCTLEELYKGTTRRMKIR